MVSHIEPHHQNDRCDYEGPVGSKEKFGAVVPPADLEPGKGDWEQFYPDCLSCCHALDENFGRVTEALKKKGIYDNTMVMYASEASGWEEAVYIQINESFVGRTLRTGRFKYVVYDPKANPWGKGGRNHCGCRVEILVDLNPHMHYNTI